MAEVVFFHDGVERAFLAVMPEFDIFHVVGDGAFPLRDRHHLVGRDKEKLSVCINEFLD